MTGGSTSVLKFIYGLVAIGLSSGLVALWNAHSRVASPAPRPATTRLQLHPGQRSQTVYSESESKTSTQEERRNSSPVPLDWYRKEEVERTCLVAGTWMEELKDFLNMADHFTHVSMVAADFSFREPLVNWLIAALVRMTPPLRNILIVTNDFRLYSLFAGTSKLFHFLLIPFNSSLYNHTSNGYHGKKAVHRMYPLLVVRTVVMRLLNYWGYDVANYDSDAILLKNPVLEFDKHRESDVVGTCGGKLPSALYHKWGVVLCMGAVLVKSTDSTSLLWEAFKHVRLMDDQIRMNYALEGLRIKWTQLNQSLVPLEIVWKGRSQHGLRTTLLPQMVACRNVNCHLEKRNKYFIWHRGRQKHRVNDVIAAAKADKVWFLRNDWETVAKGSVATGQDWLKTVYIAADIDYNQSRVLQ